MTQGVGRSMRGSTLRRVRAGLADDRGLIGKIILAWLLALALGGVAAIDAGSIVLSRYRASAAAELAAEAGAAALAAGGDESAARAAAEAAVSTSYRDAELEGLAVLEGGLVRVTVTAEPPTLLAGRLKPVLGDLAEVRERAVAGPDAG